MAKHLLIFSSFLLALNYCAAQVNIDSIYEVGPLPYCPQNKREVILTDHETGTRFILDSSRVYITAINANGAQLWRTDPYSWGPSNPYLGGKSVIVSFNFVRNEYSKGKIVIHILYDDKSGGNVDKENGHYTWLGQN